MTKTKNASKYSDSRWQKKRLEVMHRDGYKCKSCGKDGEGVTLNIHHSYYEKGVELWEYDGDTLVTLCESCHEERHWLQKHILRCMANLTNSQIYGLLHIETVHSECIEAFNYMAVNGVAVSPSILTNAIKAIADAHLDGYKDAKLQAKMDEDRMNRT